MSERQTIVLNYTPLESGNAESRWIRVEQETPEDESLSVAEAAALIDSIYEIEACDDGMGGGGEGDDGTDAPDEDKVDAALAAMLASAGMCDEAKFWTATVRVYRSHRQPGYVLRSETATVETTEPVRESRRQEVEVSGAVIELDMPYDGGLQGIPAGVKWEVRGSTVNLDRPVNGRLVLRYTTYYERVTLRVPTGGVDAEGGQGAGIETAIGGGSGGEVAGGEKTARPELPAAAVVAFWGDLAVSCDLTPPEQDDASGIDIGQICGKGGGSGGGDDPGECWKTIAHYRRCNCSYKKVDEWEEQVAAPCDGAISGAGVGYEERFDGFTNCEGEEDELKNPDYFRRRCCKNPPAAYLLPLCKKSHAVYSGGHEIENGPEHWKNLYGSDVAMIAVMPDGGTCGEVVTEWNVPSRNCCEDADPLVPSEDNPNSVQVPGGVRLCVDGGYIDPVTGRRDWAWRASAGYVFDNGMSWKNDGGRCELVQATEDACDNASIQVDDGCSRTHMALRRENPAEEMILAPNDATVAPGEQLLIHAYNARGKVHWDGGSFRLASPQGGHQALFDVPEGFCGSNEIMATDACGAVAAMTALSTFGHWEEIFGFDPCSPPWSGTPRIRQRTGNATAHGLKMLDDAHEQEWRAEFGQVVGAAWFDKDSGNHCAETVAAAIESSPCGYSGRELYYDLNGDPIFVCNESSSASGVEKCYGLCRETYSWAGTRAQWQAMSQFIERLWRWECP